MSKDLIIIMGGREDDQNNLESALKPNYSILSTTSFEEGLSLFDTVKNNTKLIILDLQLPEIDAVDAIKQIRQINTLVEIIVYSIDDQLQNCINSMKFGVYDYLVSPIDPRILQHVVNNAIESRDIYDKINDLAHQKFIQNLDHRLNLFRELLRSRRVKGQSISEEELNVFFPPHEKQNRETLDEIKSNLTKDDINNKITTAHTFTFYYI